MGQKYEGTLIIQTNDYYSPVGSRVLAPLSNPASADDIANGKGLYDGNGVLLNGSFIDGWPLEISTEEDMDAFITLENVGRYVKYTGTASQGGGAPAPVNPIAVGDTLSAIFYDTSARPDFSNIDWGSVATDADKMLPLIKGTIENLGEIEVLTAFSNEDGSYGFYFIDADFYYHGATETGWISAAGEKDSVYDIGIKELNFADLGLEGVSTATITVTEVAQQDIWGAYISKDGEWTGGAKYISGQIYQVIQQGESAELKAIQY